MSKRRVVVTGLGLITPVGIGVAESWANIINGQSGIDKITKFDCSSFPSQVAGEVKNFDPLAYIPPKDARRMDTFIQFGIAAGMEAFKDSGIEVNDSNSERIGVSVGSGIGGINLIESTGEVFDEGGVRKVSPFFIPGTIINMISGNLSIMLNLKGPNVSIVTACTTGTHSIGDAARMIEYGDADVMLAGGSEAAITELSVAGFSSAKALSSRNDDPKTASRPWDKDRDGFVIGEGAVDFGRVLIGLGLMLLALQLISGATNVLTQNPAVQLMLESLTSDRLLEILLGAALAVVAYSSLAVVLLASTLALQVVGLDVALGIVLGANLGSGLLAVITTAKSGVSTRQVPLGNLLFKVFGVAIAIWLIPTWVRFMQPLVQDPATLTVLFHLSFNLMVAVIFRLLDALRGEKG